MDVITIIQDVQFQYTQEKEKDLELAAKIGQELLERNKMLDDKVIIYFEK